MAPIKSDGNGGIIFGIRALLVLLPLLAFVLTASGFYLARIQNAKQEAAATAAERAATERDISQLRQLVDRNYVLIDKQSDKLTDIGNTLSRVEERIEGFHRGGQ